MTEDERYEQQIKQMAQRTVTKKLHDESPYELQPRGFFGTIVDIITTKSKDNLFSNLMIAGATIVTIVLFFVVIVPAFSGGLGNDKAEIWTAACHEVELQLKNPNSADFPWFKEEYVKDYGNGDYVVSSTVEAENGFGATVQQNFKVSLHYEDGHFSNVKVSIY